jgi:hypothetical protein
MTPLIRLKQIIEEALSCTQQYRKDDDGEVIWKNVFNRELAIINSGYTFSFDYGAGELRISKGMQAFEPRDETMVEIGIQALTEMGADEWEERVTPNQWRPRIISLAKQNQDDSIKRRMEEIVVLEKSKMSNNGVRSWTAEDILPMTFGLENTEYNRLWGYTLIRDLLALTLRNAFDNPEPVVPQAAFGLIGDEGDGKSEFFNVTAGGYPGQGKSSRYENEMDFDL